HRARQVLQRLLEMFGGGEALLRACRRVGRPARLLARRRGGLACPVVGGASRPLRRGGGAACALARRAHGTPIAGRSLGHDPHLFVRRTGARSVVSASARTRRAPVAEARLAAEVARLPDTALRLPAGTPSRARERAAPAAAGVEPARGRGRLVTACSAAPTAPWSRSSRSSRSSSPYSASSSAYRSSASSASSASSVESSSVESSSVESSSANSASANSASA